MFDVAILGRAVALDGTTVGFEADFDDREDAAPL